MRIAVGLLLVCALLAPGAVEAAPAGQLTWAVHVTIAPTWFDPAETPGIVTPFMMLYAMHDGLLKAAWEPAWRFTGSAPCPTSPTRHPTKI